MPDLCCWHVTRNPVRTPVELSDGHVVYVDRPADQVERDIATALDGDYAHIRWNGHLKPVRLARIERVIRNAA